MATFYDNLKLLSHIEGNYRIYFEKKESDIPFDLLRLWNIKLLWSYNGFIKCIALDAITMKWPQALENYTDSVEKWEFSFKITGTVSN